MHGQWCIDHHNWLKWYALDILQRSGAKCGIDWWPSKTPQSPAIPKQLLLNPKPATLDQWQANLLRPLGQRLKKAGLVRATCFAAGTAKLLARLAGCHVVLLDPDTGFCTQNHQPHDRASHRPMNKADHYVHTDEIAQIMVDHHVLIYQHGLRRLNNVPHAVLGKALPRARVRYFPYKGSGLLLIDGVKPLPLQVQRCWNYLPNILTNMGF